MIEEGCEARVHSHLFAGLTQYPAALILGWSPPNAKAYKAPNVVFPRLNGQGRRIGAYRVDAVFILKDILFLAEIKCRSSESQRDVRKLRHIRETLGLEGVVRSLKRQGVTVPPCRELVLAIGTEVLDSEIPHEFVSLQKDGPYLPVSYGAGVPESARGIVDTWVDHLRKNKR